MGLGFCLNNWTQILDPAPWGPRTGHKAITHNDTIYLCGGYDGSDWLNDIWSSTDGLNWTLITSGAEWPVRSNFGFIYYNNKFVVMGGRNSSGTLNDIWTWTGIETDPWVQVVIEYGRIFTPRSHFALVEVGTDPDGHPSNRLYVIGGHLNLLNNYAERDSWVSYSNDLAQWSQDVINGGQLLPEEIADCGVACFRRNMEWPKIIIIGGYNKVNSELYSQRNIYTRRVDMLHTTWENWVKVIPTFASITGYNNVINDSIGADDRAIAIVRVGSTRQMVNIDPLEPTDIRRPNGFGGSMFTERWRHQTVALWNRGGYGDGKAYLFGGQTALSGGALLGDVWEADLRGYLVQGDTWVGGGRIDPSIPDPPGDTVFEAAPYPYTSDVFFYLLAYPGKLLRDLYVNNIIVGGAQRISENEWTYLLEYVTEDKIVKALFDNAYHMVSTADINGDIYPLGDTMYLQFTNITYTIVPYENYEVSTLLIDGTPITPANSYTFYSISAPHTIDVFFAWITWEIVSSSTGPGTIDPLGSIFVDQLLSATYTITPNVDCMISQILIDGSPITPVNEYTFYGIMSGHTIDVTFETITWSIFSSSSDFGSIDPEGSFLYDQGTDVIYNMYPDTNYELVSLEVDFVSVTPTSSYTFYNINGDHTIDAVFARITHVISSSVDANGSITPLGDTSIDQATNAVYSISANTNYKIDMLIIDDVPIRPTSSYTFYNVQAPHTIKAKIVPITTNTITIENGLIKNWQRVSGGNHPAVPNIHAIVINKGIIQSWTVTVAPGGVRPFPNNTHVANIVNGLSQSWASTQNQIPLAWWKTDNSSGNGTIEEMNNRHMSWEGTPSYGPSNLGFNIESDSFLFCLTNAFNFTTNSVFKVTCTISIPVILNTYQCILSQSNDGSDTWSWGLWTLNTELFVKASGENNLFTIGANLQANTNYDIEYMYNNGVQTIRINNNLITLDLGTYPEPNYINPGSGDFYIGSMHYPSLYPFTGIVKNLKIYVY